MIAKSFRRSNVVGEQDGDLAESPGSRDVSKTDKKINGGGTSTSGIFQHL